MFKGIVVCVLGMMSVVAGSAQATIHVKSPDSSGTSTLQDPTASAAIQDYLQAWEGFRSAMAQNRADLLDSEFIGTAKDKLTATIKQQEALGIRSAYQAKSHNIQIVFYSRDGLSLELIDDVDYDVQLLIHDRQSATKNVRARYVVVMTPTETKWRVRVFQAVPE